MAKKVNITLTVEAANLFQLANTPTNIDANASFSDDNKGCAPGGKIENFQSDVFINEDVRWDGKTKHPDDLDKGYSVKIISIVYKTGTNFFDVTTLPGNGGKVTATVRDDSKLDGELYDYTINFKINDKDFTIDPKLKGNT